MNRFIFAFVAVLLLASCDKKQKTSIETAVVERGELRFCIDRAELGRIRDIDHAR